MPFMQNLQKALIKGIYQACILGCIGVALALAVNALRSDGLVILQHKTQSTATSAVMGPPIYPPEALRLYESQKALFIDARAPESYETGHVPGALNILPGTSKNAKQQLNSARDLVIILYCDGPGCDLAEHLAQELTTAGYEGVRVMPDGWPAWEGSGYPVETIP